LGDPDRGRFEQRQPEAEPQTWTGQPSERNDGELGDPTTKGLQGRQQPLRGSTYELYAWPPSPSDTDAWERVLRERPDLAPALSKEAESQFRGMDNGRSHRVDELKALGNGIVPSVVAEFLRRIT